MCGKCVREKKFGWYESKPTLTIRLPYPVSLNAAFGNSVQGCTVVKENLTTAQRQLADAMGKGKRNGRGRFKTDAYKKWIKSAQDSLWGVRFSLITEQVRVVYTLDPPKNGKTRDCANYEKVLSDFFKDMGILKDDSQIISNTQCWLSPDDGIESTKEGFVVCEIFKA